MTKLLGIGLLAFVLVALVTGCDFNNQPEPGGTALTELVEATAVSGENFEVSR